MVLKWLITYPDDKKALPYASDLLFWKIISLGPGIAQVEDKRTDT